MAYVDDAQAQRANLAFIKASMQMPLLERDHEFDLARRWRENSDVAALHELVRAHARLVISTAGRFRHYGLPAGDLVQEGNLGLMQAAARFEPARDVRFSTYASWWIRSAMQDYVLRNWSIVRTGTTVAQKSLFFNLRRLRARIEEMTGAPLSDPGRVKIADELNVPLSEVESMEQRLAASDQSLSAPIGEDGEEAWQDLLADHRPTPELAVMSMRDSRARSHWLAEALEELPSRERTIIHERRLRDDGATLEQLGRTFGISKERVRQLEHRAIGKLRASMMRRVQSDLDLLPEE